MPLSCSEKTKSSTAQALIYNFGQDGSTQIHIFLSLILYMDLLLGQVGAAQGACCPTTLPLSFHSSSTVTLHGTAQRPWLLQQHNYGNHAVSYNLFIELDNVRRIYFTSTRELQAPGRQRLFFLIINAF